MYKIIILLLVVVVSCDPFWIYKVSDQGQLNSFEKYNYEDSDITISVESHDFAFQTTVDMIVKIKQDSQILHPFYVSFRSLSSIKYYQILNNIYYLLKRNGKTIKNNRYEISRRGIQDSIFLDDKSIYQLNPKFIITNRLNVEDVFKYESIRYNQFKEQMFFSKNDSLNIEFTFPSFAHFYDGDADLSGFAMDYYLYGENNPLQFKFYPN